jgi:hypothetical protein
MEIRGINFYIIVGVAAILVFWSISRCNSKKAALEAARNAPDSLGLNSKPNTQPGQSASKPGTTTPGAKPSAQSSAKPNSPAASQPASSPSPAASPAGNSPAPAATGQKLYAVMDSLKVRADANRNGSVLAVARKGEELDFLGKTGPVDKIKINGNMTEEPWLQVRTKGGKTGWVYGALVRPYKK